MVIHFHSHFDRPTVEQIGVLVFPNFLWPWCFSISCGFIVWYIIILLTTASCNKRTSTFFHRVIDLQQLHLCTPFTYLLYSTIALIQTSIAFSEFQILWYHVLLIVYWHLFYHDNIDNILRQDHQMRINFKLPSVEISFEIEMKHTMITVYRTTAIHFYPLNLEKV